MDEIVSFDGRVTRPETILAEDAANAALLALVGERVRTARARKGISRKRLSEIFIISKTGGVLRSSTTITSILFLGSVSSTDFIAASNSSGRSFVGIMMLRAIRALVGYMLSKYPQS